MPWEIPSEDYDPQNIDKGYQAPEPGRYHVQVVNVDDDAVSKSGSPQMVVDYLILSGTTPGMAGREYRDFFSKSHTAVNRVLLFALATKVTSMAELEAHKAAKTNPVLDFSKAVGRNLCIELDTEEYPEGSGKHRVRCAFGIYPVDSPKAKGIPLDVHAEAKAGDAGDDPFGGGTGGSGNGHGGAATAAEAKAAVDEVF